MNTARRRFASAADGIFTALVALAVATEITGGLRGEILEIPTQARG